MTRGRATAAMMTAAGLLIATLAAVAQGEEDFAAQFAAAKKACDAGQASGCADLASHYTNGLGTPRDVARGYALYKQACDAGFHRGCVRVGDGEGSLVSLARQGCAMGVPISCIDLAGLYAAGLGVAKDPPRAAAYYKQACDEGESSACARLAELRKAGVAPASLAAAPGRPSLPTLPPEPSPSPEPKDPASLQKACDGGDGLACLHLGMLYAAGADVKQDLHRSNALYRKACDSPEAVVASLGCYALGLRYETGVGVKQDRKAAAALYRKACEGGSKPACAKLGR